MAHPAQTVDVSPGPAGKLGGSAPNPRSLSLWRTPAQTQEQRGHPEDRDNPVLYVLLRTARVALLRSPILSEAPRSLPRKACGVHYADPPAAKIPQQTLVPATG